MGICLQDGAVHKCARISFVPVTDDIFGKRIIAPAFFPFLTCWKPRSSSASQARDFYLLNPLLGLHGRENLRKRSISISGDIFVDTFRIDQTSIPERPQYLML